MDKNHNDNGFMNGFLLGAIIGAAVVFFLFTQKGRKLLKTITEEGIESFTDLKDLVTEEMDEEEESSYKDEYEEETHHVSVPHQVHAEPIRRHEPTGQAQSYESHHEHTTPLKTKRFFKGVKRG